MLMRQIVLCEANILQTNPYDCWGGKMPGLVDKAKSAELILLGNQEPFSMDITARLLPYTRPSYFTQWACLSRNIIESVLYI